MPGFVVERRIDCATQKTGFDAVSFSCRPQSWLVLAIRGTDEPIDLLACTSLGTCQYLANRELLTDYLADPTWQRICLVGHSLGGAICQYLAYDLVQGFPGIDARLELWTYNGLGGLLGLKRLHGRLEAASCERIRAWHFAHPGDVIPRIGGNIGGELQLVRPGRHPDPHHLSHFIEEDSRPLATAKTVRDRPFSISGSAERCGTGLRLAVEDWIGGHKGRSARVLLATLRTVPRNEWLEVARLALGIGTALVRARRGLRERERWAASRTAPAVHTEAPSNSIHPATDGD